MGFTVLGLPGIFPQELIDASSGVPPMPEGVNKVLLGEMVKLIGISKKYGYDLTKHYRESILSSTIRNNAFTSLSHTSTNI